MQAVRCSLSAILRVPPQVGRGHGGGVAHLLTKCAPWCSVVRCWRWRKRITAHAHYFLLPIAPRSRMCGPGLSPHATTGPPPELQHARLFLLS